MTLEVRDLICDAQRGIDSTPTRYPLQLLGSPEAKIAESLAG